MRASASSPGTSSTRARSPRTGWPSSSTTVNALSSERQRTAALAARVAALEAAAAGAAAEHQRALRAVETELAQERAAHAETRARLAYRETPAGWARWPLGAARRRLTGAG